MRFRIGWGARGDGFRREHVEIVEGSQALYNKVVSIPESDDPMVWLNEAAHWFYLPGCVDEIREQEASRIAEEAEA